MDAAALAGLNSFGIFDVEADRLDHLLPGLMSAGRFDAGQAARRRARRLSR